MPQSRKETAYRKSRKFGDVYGGRTAVKVTDGIFKRVHSVSPPSQQDILPVFMIDNPSRDFFFPVGEDEIREALKRLPSEDTEGITHIWLRRIRKGDYEKLNPPLAEFCCGGGVQMIVLYPWPCDMKLRFGKRKPSKRLLKEYARWEPVLIKEDDTWVLVWSEDALRSFYIDHLLLHEIGHHVDKYRRKWSKANIRQIEEAADQYAAFWSASNLRGHVVG